MFTAEPRQLHLHNLIINQRLTLGQLSLSILSPLHRSVEIGSGMKMEGFLFN